ncbi:hypothetical protein RND71_034837 [Anisodus tanguticus]|uniref:Uncharacterized protein n=1 Tax=Anisodus tanguticus TaxID=243964 RepID=A0AAE1R4B7_9SOLA|nr:hypothetical protein RND71_034837 [Anisodus tanguticus]
MASGSSGRPSNSSGSKGFDFGSDDILCSYEDYPHQDGSNGTHSDPAIAKARAKARLTNIIREEKPVKRTPGSRGSTTARPNCQFPITQVV